MNALEEMRGPMEMCSRVGSLKGHTYIYGTQKDDTDETIHKAGIDMQT